MLANDEWVSSSSEYDGRATYVLRIKTSRLSAFLAAMSDLGEVTSCEQTSKDVSVDYYDNTARKTTLENERTRLNELLSTASEMSDILLIDKRLSEIETELGIINRTINNYDSLVEYSTVTVNLYAETQYVDYKETFGERLADAYAEGWEFAKDLIIFLLAALPFLAVIAGIVVLIIYLKKRADRRKSSRQNAETKPDTIGHDDSPNNENNDQ